MVMKLKRFSFTSLRHITEKLGDVDTFAAMSVRPRVK